VVITNQSGVARGYFSLGQLEKIHRRFRGALGAKGVRLSGIYFCPHAPDAGCRCRKPKPFLVRRAAKALKLDLNKSFVVGDQGRDIELAKRAGARGVLVLTGAGRSQAPAVRKSAAHVARNLSTAADWIVRNS
jgi:histidinol-phosphate phosphatase family protein